MTQDRFATLAVCHANLCRSPLMGGLLYHALTERLGPAAASFAVSSAGTHAIPDMPMHPYSAAVLGELGAGNAAFASRPVDAGVVAQADLILTADRAQRTICVSCLPAAANRTFTLREFARLASAVDPRSLPDTSAVDRARALVFEAHLARAEFQPVTPDEDDLADPIGQPMDAFRECARAVTDSIEVMLALLAPR
jgi:protein-tyrosine phosphatase